VDRGVGIHHVCRMDGNAEATKRINVSLVDFHTIRLSMNGTSITVYDLDNDLDPGMACNGCAAHHGRSDLVD